MAVVDEQPGHAGHLLTFRSRSGYFYETWIAHVPDLAIASVKILAVLGPLYSLASSEPVKPDDLLRYGVAELEMKHLGNRLVTLQSDRL